MALHRYIEKNLVACSPDATVIDVAHLMKTHDVGAIVVTEDGFPSGIVTDRDLALRCASDDFKCANDSVRDYMTQSVETVTLDQGIQDVIRVMKSEEIRRVVVVDDSGKAISLLSFGDMISLLTRELDRLASVLSSRSQSISSNETEKKAA